LIAENVKGEAEARRVLDTAIAVQPLLYTLPGLKHAIDRHAVRLIARARHEKSDIIAVQRVGRRRHEAWNERSRIDAASSVTLARRSPDANRLVEQRRVRRPVLVGQEVCSLR